MGMRVSSGASASMGEWQGRQQAMQVLSKALQSSDIASAQSAYAKLSSSASAGGSAGPDSPLAQIGKALAANDLASAQQAFAAMRPHHHLNQTAATTPSSGSSAGDTKGWVVNINA